MKIACFIPIKTYSERVAGKNLRQLGEKKLYQYICESIKAANIFDEVYVDTNSQEVTDFAKEIGFTAISRKEELARNTANGNDLLNYHYEKYPDYDYYFQVFVTSPFLQPSTIRKCVENLIHDSTYDSCFTATENYGFYWINNLPINYRPNILPRSQELIPLIEESTGLYGVSSQALKKYKCRIGRNPYICIIDKFEAIDINTEEDFEIANAVYTQIISKNAQLSTYTTGGQLTPYC